MKKLLIIFMVLVCALVFSADTFAGKGNYGCGLGTLIFKSRDGIILQILAITTNHLTSTQAFGITSGTSECSQFSGIVSNEKINVFVADNMDSLASDIAKGSGEYLNTLAVLLEVSVKNRPEFYKKLQVNFSKIYTSDKVTHEEVLKNIETVIKAG